MGSRCAGVLGGLLLLGCGGGDAAPADPTPVAEEFPEPTDGWEPDLPPARLDVGGEPDQREFAFVDVTVEAGLGLPQAEFSIPPECLLDNVNTPADGDMCLPERASGGVAVGDFDDDGWPDLFLAHLHGPDALMRNRGDGTFEDVTAGSGLDQAWHSNGAVWGDVDLDGDLDLFVSTIGEAQYLLFIQTAPGVFAEEAVARGAALASDAPRAGTTPTFGDFDRDGDLDLFVAEWRSFSNSGSALSHMALLRNLGPEAPGFFEDVTQDVGLGHLDDLHEQTMVTAGVWAFAPALVDLDDDGWLDLALAGDFGTSRLLFNEHGTFVDHTVSAGVGTDRNGMGSSVYDIDGDGDLDWFITAISGDDMILGGNRLYLNRGDRTFEDATDRYGVRDGGWGWGAAMFDPDNDAFVEVVMTAGWQPAPYADDPMRLWAPSTGVPLDELAVEAGLDVLDQGRALAVLDYDRDGDQDLLVTHNASTPVLYRNDSEGGHWLRVRVRDATEGLGARITLEGPGAHRGVRTIGASTHYLAQSERVAHFGLGPFEGPVTVTLEPLLGEPITLEVVELDRELELEL